MRSFALIASLAALSWSAEALAQPAQPPVAGQPATTDPQPAQPPIAGQGGATAGGGGQTIIVVQGSGNGAAGAPAAPKGPPEDGARFRGGVGLDGGVFAIPSFKLNLGAIGVYGHVGGQINNLVGVYAIPEFDIIFGHLGGVATNIAAVVDFTFADRFSVGIGPDIGYFAAIGISNNGTVGAAGGAGFGARVHLAAYPAVGRSETAPRRKAFAIGLDTRILAEQGASETVGPGGVAAAAGYGVALHAMITFGYEAM